MAWQKWIPDPVSPNASKKWDSLVSNDRNSPHTSNSFEPHALLSLGIKSEQKTPMFSKGSPYSADGGQLLRDSMH